MVDCHFWEDEDYYFYSESTKSMRVDDDVTNASDEHDNDDRRRCLPLSIALIEIEELV